VQRTKGNDSDDDSNSLKIGAAGTPMRSDLAPAAPASVSERHAMAGSQVVLDLYECETDHLDDVAWVEATLVNAARAAGATIVQTVFHKFAPWGISGVVVIAESHLAIHIWPENRYAAIDVFTCGENVRMDVASALLIREFRSKRPVQRRFTRGDHVLADRSEYTAIGPSGSRRASGNERRRGRKQAASPSPAT
jgi:S-adenosylmethionine decarboxylase